ncbi:MAG: hypothetical protein J5594_02630 [Elusimicrobiaceae bacterium]|nr:hypothetical protein [Elusimicrobiaceae bacterium]
MKYKELLIRCLVFLTDKSVIVTAIVIIALILMHPYFMRVVERMKMSDTHDTMQQIAKAQKNYEMSNGRYTHDFKNLDLQLRDKHGKDFEYDYAETDDFSLVLADTGILGIRNGREYIIYYDYENSSFSCAPHDHYICKNINPVSKSVCKEAEMFWSNINNYCYINEKDRCLAIKMPWKTKGKDIFCGYKDTENVKVLEGASCIATKPSGCQNSIIFKDAICDGKSSFGCVRSKLKGGNCLAHTETACHSVQINKASTCLVNDDYSGNYGCQNVTINKDGLCLAVGSNTLACNKATINEDGICRGYANKSCNEATVWSGGVCEANATDVCQNITVKKGGKCIANVPQTCNGIYEEGSCCHGYYCPEDSPKCKCPKFATKC